VLNGTHLRALVVGLYRRRERGVPGHPGYQGPDNVHQRSHDRSGSPHAVWRRQANRTGTGKGAGPSMTSSRMEDGLRRLQRRTAAGADRQLTRMMSGSNRTSVAMINGRGYIVSLY